MSTLDIYVTLKTGGTLILIQEYLYAFPDQLIDAVIKNKVNTIFWVPSAMNMVMNSNALRDKKTELTKILFAGEVMTAKVMNYWKEHIPNAVFANLYGPTEITVICSYYIVDREFKESESLPIGYPCKNTDILILNENNCICNQNEIGELCVRGSSLAMGYINNYEKTNASFVQNPLNESYPEKIYRTGDLVKTNDKNEILYIGRKDSQIKHSGYRIELGDIENASNSLDHIQSSCVIYDEINREICLFYQSQSNILTKNIIIIALSKLIPKYMIPTNIIRLDKIPLNANGKIDRVSLKNYVNNENPNFNNLKRN
jgi:non-ribosomal peptide synthetase component F